jgi:hypothetical protein
VLLDEPLLVDVPLPPLPPLPPPPHAVASATDAAIAARPRCFFMVFLPDRGRRGRCCNL